MAEQMRADLQETFRASGWREELDVYYRMRRSVWGVLALMIVMSAFWTRPSAWVVFFLILAAYSALAQVRMGVICGLSFALWFFAGIEGWLRPGTVENRVLGLWCIATLFLLVVWKADGVHRLRDRRATDADTR
jgi:hypothetical protein